MPDLQSCYFCGTPDDVQEYAVIPPRFTPGDEEPQSAVLCEQCKTKLLQVVRPLTEQLDGGAASPERPADDSAARESAAGDTATDTEESATASESGGSGVTMSSGADDGNPAPESTAADPSAGDASTPPNYRRAVRMLSNREFPLDRSEVESMLARAYDLERHEVDAVLERAVEEGRLREEDDQFYQS